MERIVMSSSNLSNSLPYCRLCLTDDLVVSKSIFDEPVEESTLPQMILKYVEIEIKQTDTISTVVCPRCIRRVRGFHAYKEECAQNQNKLKVFNGIDENCFHIKAEPMGADGNSSNGSTVIESHTEIVSVKSEPMEQIEELVHNEFPPVLSPQPLILNGFLGFPAEQGKPHSPVGLEVQTAEDPSQPTIHFPDGSELLPTSASTIPGLSKMELSYIDKCTAMVNMHRTLTCACHNIQHQNLRSLMSHLRALMIWFPVFTCYNCMITYPDRSTFVKHIVKCKRQSLDAIAKLSHLSNRSDVKTRLYQNFKCRICKFMFSFHDDFCKHVGEKHLSIVFPHHCTCRRIFDSVKEYEDHVHVSCLVEFYCDICFITTKTLDEFQKHASAIHDKSNGFDLLQDDNYAMKRVVEHSNMEVNKTSKIQMQKRTAISDEENLEDGTDHSMENTSSETIVESSISTDKRKQMCDDKFAKCFCIQENKTMNPKRKRLLPKKLHNLYDMQTNGNQNNSSTEGESYHKCTKCCKMFISEKNMKNHIKCHEINASPNAAIVTRKSLCSTSLGKHMNDEPDEICEPKTGTSEAQLEKVSCHICTKSFPTASALASHIGWHKRGQNESNTKLLTKMAHSANITHNEPPFQCGTCLAEMPNDMALQIHMLEDHRELSVAMLIPRCSACNRDFPTNEKYEMHKRLHEFLEGKKRPDQNMLQKKEEGQEVPLHMTEPDVVAAGPKSHETEHSANLVKNVPCKYCSAVYSRTDTLRKHVRQNHKDVIGEAEFKCTLCDRTFEKQSALTIHLKVHMKYQGM